MIIKLLNSATRMESLYERYAQQEELDDKLLEDIKQVQSHIRQNVDEVIQDLNYLKSQMKHAEMMSHSWVDRKARLEVILDKKKEYILNVIKAFEAEGIPVQGDHGRLKAVRNSLPSLIVEEGNEDLRQRYTKSKWIDFFDKAQLKKDLMDGIKIEGAKLEYGEHLRY